MNFKELSQEQREQVADEKNVSVEVLEAYNELGIEEDGSFENVEEAYVGEYPSDEEFAQDMAEQLGAVDFKNQPWPQYCIDWECAARELMMDYSEQDGYYFRNL